MVDCAVKSLRKSRTDSCLYGLDPTSVTPKVEPTATQDASIIYIPAAVATSQAVEGANTNTIKQESRQTALSGEQRRPTEQVQHFGFAEQSKGSTVVSIGESEGAEDLSYCDPAEKEKEVVQYRNSEGLNGQQQQKKQSQEQVCMQETRHNIIKGQSVKLQLQDTRQEQEWQKRQKDQQKQLKELSQWHNESPEQVWAQLEKVEQLQQQASAALQEEYRKLFEVQMETRQEQEQEKQQEEEVDFDVDQCFDSDQEMNDVATGHAQNEQLNVTAEATPTQEIAEGAPPRCCNPGAVKRDIQSSPTNEGSNNSQQITKTNITVETNDNIAKMCNITMDGNSNAVERKHAVQQEESVGIASLQRLEPPTRAPMPKRTVVLPMRDSNGQDLHSKARSGLAQKLASQRARVPQPLKWTPPNRLEGHPQFDCLQGSLQTRCKTPNPSCAEVARQQDSQPTRGCEKPEFPPRKVRVCADYQPTRYVPNIFDQYDYDDPQNNPGVYPSSPQYSPHAQTQCHQQPRDTSCTARVPPVLSGRKLPSSRLVIENEPPPSLEEGLDTASEADYPPPEQGITADDIPLPPKCDKQCCYRELTKYYGQVVQAVGRKKGKNQRKRGGKTRQEREQPMRPMGWDGCGDQEGYARGDSGHGMIGEGGTHRSVQQGCGGERVNHNDATLSNIYNDPSLNHPTNIVRGVNNRKRSPAYSNPYDQSPIHHQSYNTQPNGNCHPQATQATQRQTAQEAVDNTGSVPYWFGRTRHEWGLRPKRNKH